MNNLKFIIGLVLLVLFSSFSSILVAQNPNFHIYLCFGQSNMEGQGKVEAIDKTVDERFKVLQSIDCASLSRTKGEWYTAIPPLVNCWSGLSPADYFGKSMIANLPDSITIGIINVAVGGCDIRLFDKDIYHEHDSTYAESWFTDKVAAYGGNPYKHLIDLAIMAQQDGVIKGILLHQGETNNGDTDWPNYVNKIYNDMLTDLTLESTKTPLLAGEVLSIDGSCCGSMNDIIQTLPEFIDNAHIISSEGLTGMDNAHFDSEGYRRFGRRYASEMLSLMGYISIDVEAECSTLGESLLVEEDSDASNNAYVTIDNATEMELAGTLEVSANIQFDFTAVSNTIYYAFGRFNNESIDNDAMYVKVNDGNDVLYDDLTTDGWEWKPLGSYELLQGKQSISLAFAEESTKIDKLVLKNTNIRPVGFAGDAITHCSIDFEQVSVNDEGVSGYKLEQNYPNPANGDVSITFEVPQSSYVSLILYNVMGVKVVDLAGELFQAGAHTIQFNAGKLNVGTYYYTINTGSFKATRKMLLLTR